MIIIKSLNNNMVLAKDSDGREKICQGKGIGFHKKSGDDLDPQLVERIYVPESDPDRQHFMQLFSEIPDVYWEIAEDVVRYGREKYRIQVSDRLILPLCDHMAGSIERSRKGISLVNPMLWDIKRIYSTEYQIGKYALEKMEVHFGVRMQDDEAAFLAWHIVNAELGSMPEVTPDYLTKFIGEILDIVQQSFQIRLNEEDWNYVRFLTHLKFFARRIAKKAGHQGEADLELYESLVDHYPKINLCVERIADHILIEYHYDLDIDERMYLLIHIQRVTKRFLKKQS